MAMQTRVRFVMRPQDVPIVHPPVSTGVPQCCGQDMVAWHALPGATIWRCTDHG